MNIINYIKSTKEELNLVSWVSRAQATNHTIFVVALSIFVAVFLSVVDFGLKNALAKFLENIY